MTWLWMAAVALLALFLLVLCWYFFSEYSCCPCRKKDYACSILPTTDPNAQFTSPAEPSAPEQSPMVALSLAPKKLSQVIFDENGITTLDLHGMTVAEARTATQGFIRRQKMIGSPHIQIITGKGIHSANGEAKIKPIIRNILLGESLTFREGSQGGSYIVYL